MCGDSESESMVKDMEQMIAALNTTRCSCLHLTKKQILGKRESILKNYGQMNSQKRIFGFLKFRFFDLAFE